MAFRLILLFLIFAGGCSQTRSPVLEIRDSLLEFGRDSRKVLPVEFVSEMFVTLSSAAGSKLVQHDSMKGINGGQFVNYWLPVTIDATIEPGSGNNTASIKAAYEWDATDPLPVQKSFTEAFVAKDGTARETRILHHSTVRVKEMDRSKCYLAGYGLVEPDFSGNRSRGYFGWILAGCAVLLAGRVVWVFVKSRGVGA